MPQPSFIIILLWQYALLFKHDGKLLTLFRFSLILIQRMNLKSANIKFFQYEVVRKGPYRAKQFTGHEVD